MTLLNQLTILNLIPPLRFIFPLFDIEQRAIILLRFSFLAVAQTVTEMEMHIMNDQIAQDLEVALAEVMGDD